MKTTIKVYNNLKQKVSYLYHKLKLNALEHTKGRPLVIQIVDIITLGLIKSKLNIESKKSLAELFDLMPHYKTLVVNLNRFAQLVLMFIYMIMATNKQVAHSLKHTDSTDLPVCLPKNAKHHRSMRGLAAWGKNGKGWFYGLKLHLTSDLKRRVLALSFTSGNRSDASIFLKLNRGLTGVIVADAGYTGEQLAHDFHKATGGFLLARPRKNMRKIMSALDVALYRTRMMVEWNFRSLKMTYGIVTSLPRSINGYLAHYLYALSAFLMA